VPNWIIVFVVAADVVADVDVGNNAGKVQQKNNAKIY
jgi:hypothetical protein